MKRRQKKQRRAQAAARSRGQRQTARRPIARQRAQAVTAQAAAAELDTHGLPVYVHGLDPTELAGLTTMDELDELVSHHCPLCAEDGH